MLATSTQSSGRQPDATINHSNWCKPCWQWLLMVMPRRLVASPDTINTVKLNQKPLTDLICSYGPKSKQALNRCVLCDNAGVVRDVKQESIFSLSEHVIIIQGVYAQSTLSLYIYIYIEYYSGLVQRENRKYVA